MHWNVLREGSVPLDLHEELAGLLRAAYPHFPEFFQGRRSWSYVRPELRVIGWDDGRPVATAGVLRRFIDVEGTDQLAGVVGLVSVHPSCQRSGVGLALMREVRAALLGLDVPFGLLMCAPRHVAFYERAGWSLLSPRRVRYSPDDTTEPQPFVDEIARTTMVVRATATADAEWPEGAMDWNGASV
ncbi:GNAT family N-acetyltransferase [Pseudonocardia sp. WMMC193]|uniref:GNAT family N-acetyltransferase n=1 Tax=Pseudonocardia sp. WMMC193 TaxID=2911965 RepID=UPI001F47E5A7|nr:GNAT family N-acetyltransferase [Pseudonocardia sp. WMMC193]MCF7551247.1 GNAT family N-acetyltransferase [Pseudonocardia sp. WMMC193]